MQSFVIQVSSIHIQTAKSCPLCGRAIIIQPPGRAHDMAPVLLIQE